MNEILRRRRFGGVQFDAPTRNPDTLLQGTPPGPQRLGGGQREVLAQQAVQAVQPVREVNRYPNLITIASSNIALGSTLAIPIPDGRRIWLSARNCSNSTGILFIGIGVAAAQLSAQFELNPGGMLLFDTVIPQQEIFVGASAVGVNIVLAFADSQL